MHVDLPAPLAQLSPWLDWLTTGPQQVYNQLGYHQRTAELGPPDLLAWLHRGR